MIQWLFRKGLTIHVGMLLPQRRRRTPDAVEFLTGAEVLDHLKIRVTMVE